MNHIGSLTRIPDQSRLLPLKLPSPQWLGVALVVIGLLGILYLKRKDLLSLKVSKPEAKEDKKTSFTIFEKTNNLSEAKPGVNLVIKGIFKTNELKTKYLDERKLFAYQKLIENRHDQIGEQIIVSKYACKEFNTLKETKIFKENSPRVQCISGVFSYDASTQEVIHWTANFAGAELFQFCHQDILAQDELQVLEHPLLNGLAAFEDAELKNLDNCVAILLQGIPRMGSLDTTGIYGRFFAQASQEDIEQKLKRLDPPIASNIFALTVPPISGQEPRQLYQQDLLEQFFFRVFTAFYGIKATSGAKKAVIHTGKLGAGAFGHDPKTSFLLQLAAAMFVEVEEIRIYPMDKTKELEEALQLLEQIKKEHPHMTIGQFLAHLAQNAEQYNLFYPLDAKKTLPFRAEMNRASLS